MKEILKFFTVFAASICAVTSNAQWTQLVSNVNPTLQINGMDFINADTGFVVGGAIDELGFIRKTTDGTTWATSPNPFLSPKIFRDVKIIDKNIAFICGFDCNTYNTTGGAIIKTVDGGASWTIQNSSTYPGFFAMHFFNKDTGFVVGYCGIILKTVNGGTNWTQIPSGVTDNLREIHFPTPDTGYIVAEYNSILKTVDKGNTWSIIPSGVPTILVGCYFTSADTGFTWGGGKILKTTNGGTSWTITNTSHFIQSICFPHPDTAYAVGSYGDVLKTTDAGISWTSQPISGFGNYGLYSVHFCNTSIGYTGGYNGKLYKTTNGGGFISGVDPISEEQDFLSISHNPFSTQTVLQQEQALHNATLTVKNCSGQTVKEIKNISGQTILFSRDNLPGGLYFVLLTEGGKLIAMDKLVIID